MLSGEGAGESRVIVRAHDDGMLKRTAARVPRSSGQGGCETLEQQRTLFQGVTLAARNELGEWVRGTQHGLGGGSAELAIRRTDRMDSGTSAILD